MKTGPYPDLFAPDFFAMPMALSSAWMDFWFMPMRLSMAFLANAPGAPGMGTLADASGRPAKASRNQSETDRIVAKAEDELAEMDEAPANTKVNLSALVS